MKAITSKEARQKLDEIIDRVSLDVEPNILCSDRGTQAILMSLYEFNLDKKSSIYYQIQPMQNIYSILI